MSIKTLAFLHCDDRLIAVGSFILYFRYFHIMNWAIPYRLNPLKEVMPNLV